MVPLVRFWAPIIVSAVGVFIVSSIIHMLLKFWHSPDYQGLSNEEEVGAAIRNGNPTAGMYMIPYCHLEEMKRPEAREKFERGPVGFLTLRPNGFPKVGNSMLLWFVFSLVVSIFSAYIGGLALGANASAVQVLRIIWTVAFMSYGLAALPNSIWWAQPWGPTFKSLVDGVVYSLVTAAVFIWLWPH